MSDTLDLAAIKDELRCCCGHERRLHVADGDGRCAEDNDRDWYCACPGFRPTTQAEATLALADEVERLTAELAAVKEHTLNSNPALRALHANAVAYLKAVEAYSEKTGGPLSTSFEWLIRAGYLVPASPGVLQSDAYSKGQLDARVTFGPVAEVERCEAETARLRAAVAKIDAWARGNYGGAKSPAEVWPGLAAILRAALSDAAS